MEERYNKLRKELDEFGYKLPLVPDAVPLVEKITNDLIQTTDSLRRYMQIAKDALEVMSAGENLVSFEHCINLSLLFNTGTRQFTIRSRTI